jgi:hypothetical protein
MQLGGDDYGRVVKAIKGDVLSLVRAFVPLCCGGRGVGRATKLRSVDRRSVLRRKGLAASTNRSLQAAERDMNI